MFDYSQGHPKFYKNNDFANELEKNEILKELLYKIEKTKDKNLLKDIRIHEILLDENMTELRSRSRSIFN